MADQRDQYTYTHIHGDIYRDGRWLDEWHIYKRSKAGHFDWSYNDKRKPVWTFPFLEEHWQLDEPPAEVRAKYEELIGYDPDHEGASFVNIVELIDDGEGGGFNQPCRYGNLCEGHAVYCHNEKWLYGPRKCRRTWYTGGARRDEDCPGFEPNPHYPASGMEARRGKTEGLDSEAATARPDAQRKVP